MRMRIDRGDEPRKLARLYWMNAGSVSGFVGVSWLAIRRSFLVCFCLCLSVRWSLTVAFFFASRISVRLRLVCCLRASTAVWWGVLRLFDLFLFEVVFLDDRRFIHD